MIAYVYDNPNSFLISTATRASVQRAHAPLPGWLDRSRAGIDEPALELDAEDVARFIRTLSESRLIARHSELLGWLKGEMQQFLPHEILIAAWGDFQKWNVKYEVVSHLPDVRAAPIGPCAIDDLLRDSLAHWIRGGRQPLLLEAVAAAGLREPCICSLHRAFHGMRSLLVHGVRDKRSGCDSLYIALAPGRLVEARGHNGFLAHAHVLLCQVDIVWRRLAAFRLDDLPGADVIAVPRALDLSAREHEILGKLCRGSTNNDIAEALDISLFTVKNHLKRIFRKIGVSNRTQAATRYNGLVTQSGQVPAS